MDLNRPGPAQHWESWTDPFPGRAHRTLHGEPLTPGDWQQIWFAHRAFTLQVRLIVAAARQRAIAEAAQHLAGW